MFELLGVIERPVALTPGVMSKSRSTCLSQLLVGALACLAIMIPAPLCAHPHVFIDAAAVICCDGTGLAGMRMTWTFDEMFSSMIMLDFDANRNGRLDGRENNNVEAGAFSNLKEFDYFIHISVDGVPFPVKTVREFSARNTGGRVQYSFFVPCPVPASDVFRKVTVGVYDTTFYTDILLLRDDISYEKSEDYDITHHIEPNREAAYYFDQIIPEEIIVRFRSVK